MGASPNKDHARILALSLQQYGYSRRSRNFEQDGRVRGKSLDGGIFGIEGAQGIGVEAAARKFVELVHVASEVTAQCLAVGSALIGRAQTVDCYVQVRALDAQLGKESYQHGDHFGVD